MWFLKKKFKIKLQIVALLEYNPKQPYFVHEMVPILGKKNKDIYKILRSDGDFFFDRDCGETMGWRLSKYNDVIFLDKIENLPNDIKIGQKAVYNEKLWIIKKENGDIILDLFNNKFK